MFKNVKHHLVSFVNKNDKNFSNLCPVTYNYQLQHHRKEKLRNTYSLSLFEQSSSDSYPCYFELERPHKERYYCSQSKFVCPAQESYFPILLSSLENTSAQICDFFSEFDEIKGKNRSKNKVFVLGGSITTGLLTGGCHKGDCAELIKGSWVRRCKIAAKGCSSQDSFLYYLQEHLHHGIVHIDIAMGATSTCTAPHVLLRKSFSKNWKN